MPTSTPPDPSAERLRAALDTGVAAVAATAVSAADVQQLVEHLTQRPGDRLAHLATVVPAAHLGALVPALSDEAGLVALLRRPDLPPAVLALVEQRVRLGQGAHPGPALAALAATGHLSAARRQELVSAAGRGRGAEPQGIRQALLRDPELSAGDITALLDQVQWQLGAGTAPLLGHPNAGPAHWTRIHAVLEREIVLGRALPPSRLSLWRALASHPRLLDHPLWAPGVVEHLVESDAPYSVRTALEAIRRMLQELPPVRAAAGAGQADGGDTERPTRHAGSRLVEVLGRDVLAEALLAGLRHAGSEEAAPGVAGALDALADALPAGVLAGTPREPWAVHLAEGSRAVRTLALRLMGRVLHEQLGVGDEAPAPETPGRTPHRRAAPAQG